ncbi:MAG: MFS transporter [Pseudomonadota bacterium]
MTNTPAPNPRAALLREPNFRWMMGGGLVSAMGDQFTMIALPWLVLKLTGDPLALGLVIALMSIPRAIFILIGGALVDRSSPKAVLMVTKYANAVLLGLLAVLVLSQNVSLPAVCALALGIGLASAFSIPAGTSLLPSVVEPGSLQLANGMLMGVRQVTMLAGPLLAGLLFALAGDGGDKLTDARGLGYAFAFDCFSFVLSAWTLSKVQAQHAAPAAAPAPLFAAVGAGLKMVWEDTALRTCMLYWALCAFIVGGTMQVALPVLASTRLHGASALGLVMGAHGAGTLLGMALTGIKGNLRLGNLGTTLLVVDAIVGLLLIPFANVTASWQAAGLMLIVGVLAGFMQVAVFSWIQRRVPRPMLGRAMSIFMFIFMGLAPLAAAVTGWLMQRVTLTQLFSGSGLFLIAAALLAYLFTPIRSIADEHSGRAQT